MLRVVAYQSQLTKTDSLGVRGLLWSEANPLWSRRPRRNFVVVRTQTQEHCFTEDREAVAPNFLLGRNSIGFSLCLSICPWSNGYPRFNGIDRLVLDTDSSDTTVVRSLFCRVLVTIAPTLRREWLFHKGVPGP